MSNEGKDRILRMIPRKLRNTNNTELLRVQQIELDIIKEKIKDLLLQCFIETCTWSIDDWEREYGIEINTTLPLDVRRSRVIAKKRGVAPFTIKTIKLIASSFCNCNVEVELHNTEYYFIVNFITTSLEVDTSYTKAKAFLEAIEEFKPAHLGCSIAIEVDTGLNFITREEDIKVKYKYCSDNTYSYSNVKVENIDTNLNINTSDNSYDVFTLNQNKDLIRG